MTNFINNCNCARTDKNETHANKIAQLINQLIQRKEQTYGTSQYSTNTLQT